MLQLVTLYFIKQAALVLIFLVAMSYVFYKMTYNHLLNHIPKQKF